MNSPWSTDRLLEAIGQLCNGTISEADGRELDELLAEDPQARRLYTNYMWMHACLYAEGGSLAPLRTNRRTPAAGCISSRRISACWPSLREPLPLRAGYMARHRRRAHRRRGVF